MCEVVEEKAGRETDGERTVWTGYNNIDYGQDAREWEVSKVNRGQKGGRKGGRKREE